MTADTPRRGFSLIELLAVLGIVGIVLAIMFPAMTAGREAARKIACRNSLRQVGLALHLYQNAHERFPSGYVAARNEDPLRTGPGWSWRTMLLQNFEQQPIWKCIDFNKSIANPVNSTAVMTNISSFTCPSDRARGDFQARNHDGKSLGMYGSSSFAGNYGSGGDVAGQPGRGNGFFVRNRAFTLDAFEDGLSNTFAVGERAAMHTKTAWVGAIDGAVCRIAPGAASRSREIGRGAVQVFAHVGDRPLNSIDSGPEDFFSAHRDGGHFLMGDGSVRFVRSSMNLATLRALASRNGGEMISGSKD